MKDSYPLVNPDDMTDSTIKFAELLRARLSAGQPPAPSDEVTRSNADLGYTPPPPEHPSVQPHPKASATAIGFSLNG
jgi:hypothetical protein